MTNWNWGRFSVYPSRYSDKFLTIGPGGARVSFSAQQRRATILASLFAQKYQKKRDKLVISIIGGGVSGVTLFALLHSLGFHQTHLFEKDATDVLRLQINAPHRMAHPSYNTWPNFTNFESTVGSSALFPWGAGSVDAVLDQIRTQFDEFLASNSMADEKYKLDHEVDEVLDIKSNDQVEGVQIRFGSGQHEFNSDYAIAATGFGAETAVNNTSSYWQRDNLEVIKANIRNGEENRFVIAGNGDGALIDAARIAYRGATDDITVFEQLHLGAIFELRNSAYQMPAKTIRSALKSLSQGQRKSRGELCIINLENKLAENPDEAGALAANKGYSSENSLQSAIDKIQKALCPDCCRSLRVVGSRLNLMTPGTAPVNKLVIAQVQLMGCTTERGKLMVRTSEDGPTELQPGILGPYTIVDGQTELDKHDEELNHPDTHVLCRVGAKANVVDMVRGSKEKGFRDHFENVGDLQELDAIADANALSAVENIRAELGVRSAVTLEGLARNHIETWFGDEYSLVLMPGRGDRVEHFRIDYPSFEDPVGKAKRLGGFDHHLFGIPVFFLRKPQGGDKINPKPTRKRRAA